MHLNKSYRLSLHAYIHIGRLLICSSFDKKSFLVKENLHPVRQKITSNCFCLLRKILPCVIKRKKKQKLKQKNQTPKTKNNTKQKKIIKNKTYKNKTKQQQQKKKTNKHTKPDLVKAPPSPGQLTRNQCSSLTAGYFFFSISRCAL